MIAVLEHHFKGMGRLLAVMALGLLAACDPAGLSGGNNGPSINTSAPVPVALLVPRGSGKASDDALSQSLENAARLAIADIDGAVIELTVYSTAGTPEGAAAAATNAVNDGAKIILGPLYAQAANAAGVAVARRNINVLSFSNNTQIAGGNVFVLGNTFDNTARRLMQYAVSRGRNRVMILHAQNLPGEIGRAAISGAAQGAGAQVVGVESYPFDTQSIISAVPQISASVRASGADTVFLTSDTAGELPVFAQLLPENRIDPSQIRYMGLSRWDIPASTMALPGLQGGWFAVPDPSRTSLFESRYQAAYGSAPLPLAGIAYDGIAAIGALVSAGNRDALTTAALTQPSGFVGVNGVFRLRSDGTNDRALAVAEVQGGARAIIDPAPTSFGGF